jgi:hypothetical protein
MCSIVEQDDDNEFHNKIKKSVFMQEKYKLLPFFISFFLTPLSSSSGLPSLLLLLLNGFCITR